MATTMQNDSDTNMDTTTTATTTTGQPIDPPDTTTTATSKKPRKRHAPKKLTVAFKRSAWDRANVRISPKQHLPNYMTRKMAYEQKVLPPTPVRNKVARVARAILTERLREKKLRAQLQIINEMNATAEEKDNLANNLFANATSENKDETNQPKATIADNAKTKLYFGAINFQSQFFAMASHVLRIMEQKTLKVKIMYHTMETLLLTMGDGESTYLGPRDFSRLRESFFELCEVFMQLEMDKKKYKGKKSATDANGGGGNEDNVSGPSGSMKEFKINKEKVIQSIAECMKSPLFTGNLYTPEHIKFVAQMHGIEKINEHAITVMENLMRLFIEEVVHRAQALAGGDGHHINESTMCYALNHLGFKF